MDYFVIITERPDSEVATMSADGNLSNIRRIYSIPCRKVASEFLDPTGSPNDDDVAKLLTGHVAVGVWQPSEGYR